ncbi:strain CBS138 chromosome D complete sequence,related [Neospora caninum Liverpool]|uniref:Strain CBS138 chromosome D complete sequence,related n=1 Tax=Neospora caninum (strain Liverpool) TaxID=572307 RepID=F0VAM5_NEOCL|nr:strain CBS138 chromosome D complete sequence,related [Neospora caninum Liverpool]CBZ50780.1 strain CBS138 chromosome D complete sequence,related [Neospora caninum Liverpool]|eukprot:XP_003880813.1 strain CBS138 chromosome D complete sequence,related [Neospora caninum Liverpool]
MDELIPVVNRLQDVLVSLGASSAGPVLDLPQIAVVGAQSVGKSSVLEALVGRSFLPRGTGIVTRRPLILQLQNAKDIPEEYGEFLHCPSHKFTDFDEIRKEIERETERVGGKKNISPSPIVLKISSPHVIDLTLVDLPGITKVPVGDQPTDIEAQIRRIVFQFISEPSTIILAVTAANTDIANSDSLKIAREADPEGVRTVGVVTKVDTLEEGADCSEVLRNRIIPLKRGYVGVVCRGQRHTAEKMSIREGLKEEESFFRSHPAYRAIASKQGIPFLAKLLNQMLMKHIREALPELRSRISRLLQKTEAELATYGDPLLEAKANPGALLLHFFSRFARNFQDAIEGKLQAHQSSEHLMGGARINFIFHDWYSRALAEFDPLEGLSDHEIRTAIRNATGPKAALFVPEGAFEILVRRQIQQLETPSLQCVEQVYEELQKIVEKCELPEMARFSSLRERVMDVVRGVLRRCLAPTNQMIHNIIQIELAYINTNHPDFMNNRFGPSSGRESPSLAPSHRRRPSAETRQPSRSHSGGSGMGISVFAPESGSNSAAAPGPPPSPLLTPPPLLSQANQIAAAAADPPTDQIGCGISLPQVPSIVAPSDVPSEREQIETDLIKSLIWSYFQIVRKNVSDAVPKSIMYFMVNTAKDVLQRELVAQLYREELFGELMKEADDVAERRMQCKQLLRSLRAAGEVISHIRDFSLSDGASFASDCR